MRAHAAEVAVQRQAGFLGRGARHRHADRQRGVGAQAALVVGAVEVDQRLVEEGLLGGVEAQHRFADLGVDVLDRAQHALAEVARLVAVAQLDRLAGAGGRAARAPRRGPSCRFPAARRIRRWGCRGCPGSPGRRCRRWRSCSSSGVVLCAGSDRRSTPSTSTMLKYAVAPCALGACLRVGRAVVERLGLLEAREAQHRHAVRLPVAFEHLDAGRRAPGTRRRRP